MRFQMKLYVCIRLYALQSETKIMIRGKGATKDGKVGRSLLPQPGEDEPLHALITGYTPETVKKGVDLVGVVVSVWEVVPILETVNVWCVVCAAGSVAQLQCFTQTLSMLTDASG